MLNRTLVLLLALVMLLALGASGALAEGLEIETASMEAEIPEEAEVALWTEDMAVAEADAQADAAVMPAEGGQGVAIDEASFPDGTLRNYVQANFDGDGDGFLSDDEIAAVEGIYLGSDDEDVRGECASLEGIALFTNLKELFVQRTSIRDLDVSGNPRLEVLACHSNALTSLDVSNNPALKELYCWDNNLTKLDLTQNTKLTHLGASANKLNKLDLTRCTALKELDVENNQLTALDISKNTKLQSLWCNGNLIAKLDIASDRLKNLIGSAQCDLTEDAAVWTDPEDPENYSLHTPVCAQLVSGNTVLASFGVWFDAAGFPDETLREYLRAGFDENGDGFLSDGEAAAVEGIYVGSDDENVRGACASVKGIERFPNLRELFVQRTMIKSLDVSGNPNLEVLACNCNGLTKLDVSKNTALRELYCWENNLTRLDLTHNTKLEKLGASINKLKKLDLTKCRALKELDVEKNKLTKLDLSKCKALVKLYCGDNAIGELDVSKNTKLEILYCWENKMKKLNLGNNKALIELNVFDNKLTSLKLTRLTRLEALNCGGNKLTKLDVSKCTKLQMLDCGGNELKELNISKNKALVSLIVDGNPLTELNASKNSKLTALRCDCGTIDRIDIARQLPAGLRKLVRKNRFKVKDGVARINPSKDGGIWLSTATTVVDGRKTVRKGKG